MRVLYMVCDEANVDPATQQCTQVQYVQAPSMIPPLSLSAGAALGSALFGVWMLAACWKTLTNV